MLQDEDEANLKSQIDALGDLKLQENAAKQARFWIIIKSFYPIRNF